MAQQDGNERLYGLDWLRIGAFALLILYHIGMVFVPWDWHVKTAQPVEWLVYPMLAINPWRLMLLFVISGFASRALLSKLGSGGAFAGQRSKRLLIPLLAGMVLFVPPQPWAELRSDGVISAGYAHFWLQEYFRFGSLGGVALPTWNHLWFVAYLWAYTMVLALLSVLPDAAKAHLQQAFDRVFSGAGLFVWPVLYLLAARLLLFPRFGETHALLDDAYAHSVYGFAFFFGVGLARSQRLWQSILVCWKPAAAAALLGFGVLAAVEFAYPGNTRAPALWLDLAWLGRSVQAWGAIIALLGAARLFLNRDGPARRYLTEAVFPYYIAHQTIIVLAAFWLAPLRLGAAAEFAILLPVTVVGCFLTFEVGRRIAWLRPLIGLRRGERFPDRPAVPARAAA